MWLGCIILHREALFVRAPSQNPQGPTATQQMKFSEKYELLESLTTGAIETFAANDKVRGERVLVHIVECAPQKPDQSVSEWVIESFRRLAPEPAGPILETGKYSGAKYAYLVTKPADETAVKGWVRRYELMSEDTKETSVQPLHSEVAPLPASPTPAEKPQESRPAPGQMTQLFQDFDSLMKSKSSSPGPENTPPVRPINLAGESGLHAAAWDPASVKPATPPVKQNAPDSFSRPPKPVSPEPPAMSSREGPKPGEFTSFFQGPFRGDAPADVPAFSSEPIEPPRKSVGEFTAMFGQAPPAPASENVPGNKASGSFTGLFKDMEKPQPFNSPAHAGAVIPPSIEPVSMPPAASVASSSPQAPIFVGPSAPIVEPVISPMPSAPPVPPERPLPARPSAVRDGATGAFMRPPTEPPPAPAAPPSGPSPYTQIISRPKMTEPDSGEPMQTSANAAPAGGFAAPPMPKMPAPVAPPLPKMPPPPPMPKIAAPKPPAAPKAPKLEAAPAPSVSYWPLIITLGVLLLLAVLLVVYFVLKH